MGVFGLGLVTLISYSVKVVIVVVHVSRIETLRECFFWPDRSALMNWVPYLRISLPATIMLCSEVWAIKILGVFAAWISVEDQAANAILITLFTVMFMVPYGA